MKVDGNLSPPRWFKSWFLLKHSFAVFFLFHEFGRISLGFGSILRAIFFGIARHRGGERCNRHETTSDESFRQDISQVRLSESLWIRFESPGFWLVNLPKKRSSGDWNDGSFHHIFNFQLLSKKRSKPSKWSQILISGALENWLTSGQALFFRPLIFGHHIWPRIFPWAFWGCSQQWGNGARAASPCLPRSPRSQARCSWWW